MIVDLFTRDRTFEIITLLRERRIPLATMSDPTEYFEEENYRQNPNYKGNCLEYNVSCLLYISILMLFVLLSYLEDLHSWKFFAGDEPYLYPREESEYEKMVIYLHFLILSHTYLPIIIVQLFNSP